MESMELLKEIAVVLEEGSMDKLKQLTQQALDEGLDPATILNEGLIAGMSAVGAKFKASQIYIPEVLLSARAMHGAMEVLKPALSQQGITFKGKVLLGTVKGDLHDIGKNLVRMMLEGAGFQVIDVGIDVPAEEFVRLVREESPQILALSALLTSTMQQMDATITALVAACLRDSVKVMIGGAPVSQQYADEIGADGYAPDASTAVDKAIELLGMAG